MTIILELDATAGETIRSALGQDTTVATSFDALRRHLASEPMEDSAVLGPNVDLQAALELADSMRIARPSLGVVLVRRRVDASLLAEALRAGVREVVEERDLAGLNAAVRRSGQLARALRDHDSAGATDDSRQKRGTVVTVFSAKGGCGKTTLSTNLAAALAGGGRRQVCLIDLDLAFGDVAIALQLFPAHTIADAVPLAETLDAPALLSLLTQHSPGLTALVAPVDPGTAEAIPASLVGDILDLLRGQFDYLVIDTPPAFDDHVLAALDRSDVVALIATLDIPALKALKLTLETLDLLNYPREKLRIVMNRSDSKVGLSLSEVQKTLRVPISAHVASSRDVPASINRGVPIVLDSPKHPVTQAIRTFGEEHIVSASSEPIPTTLRTDRRRLLRRKAGSA